MAGGLFADVGTFFGSVRNGGAGHGHHSTPLRPFSMKSKPIAS